MFCSFQKQRPSAALHFFAKLPPAQQQSEIVGVQVCIQPLTGCPGWPRLTCVYLMVLSTKNDSNAFSFPCMQIFERGGSFMGSSWVIRRLWRRDSIRLSRPGVLKIGRTKKEPQIELSHRYFSLAVFEMFVVQALQSDGLAKPYACLLEASSCQPFHGWYLTR